MPNSNKIPIHNSIRGSLSQWIRLIYSDLLFEPLVADFDQFQQNFNKGFMTKSDFSELQDTFNYCQAIFQDSPFKTSFKFFRVLAGFFNTNLPSNSIPNENQIQTEVEISP